MKRFLFISIVLLFAGLSLPAQTFHMVYSYDTLGNRTGKVMGAPASGAGKAVGADNAADGDDGRSFNDSYSDSLFLGADALLLSWEAPSDNEPTVHGPLIKTRAEKEAYIAGMRAEAMAIEPGRNGREAGRDLNSYDVGEIPLQWGVSPSGARTYSIPIATAPDIRYAPELALVYNNQGGYGYGGFGWDLGGLSSITLSGKTLYYDGEITPADVRDTSAVFVLDGVRLVRNEDPATAADYPLVTATGHILASPVRNQAGYTRYFNVRFPNGVSATYGPTSLDLDSQLISYPMTLSENLDGDRIQYVYEFDGTDGSSFLTGVRYGFDSSGSPAGVIAWQYTEAPDYSYYAGKKLRRKPRIDTVASTSDGETLRRYSLSYDSFSGTDLLSLVELDNAKGGTLPPLSFTYGYEANPHQGDDSLTVARTTPLPEDFRTYYPNLDYRRGKFVRGSYNDGLLGIIADSTYTQTGDRLFACSYPGDYPLCFAPSIYDSDTTSVILAEPGFLTAEAVDIDGDGVDEVVKVNCVNTTSAGSTYKIKVYRSDSYGVPLLEDSLSVLLPSSIRNGSVYSPSQRTFRWGDFIGDGKTRLLVISYRYNIFHCSQMWGYTLVDLGSGETLFEDYTGQTLPAVSPDDEGGLLCLDIDGDSRTELCLAGSGGLRTYGYEDGTFVLKKTHTALTTDIVTGPDTYFTDINADGYIDVLKAPEEGTQWDLYTNTGLDFIPGTITIGGKSAGDAYLFIDINRDGYPDALKQDRYSLGYYLNREGTAFAAYHTSHSQVLSSSGMILPGNVVDYTSMSAFINVDGLNIREYRFTTHLPEMRQVVRSTDSYGKVIRSTYGYLPHSSLYWTDNPAGINTSQGFQLRVLPLYVLTASKGFLSEGTGAQLFLQDTYAWFDGVANTCGLGFCGFSKTLESSYLDGEETVAVSRFDPQRMGVLTGRSWHLEMESHAAFRTISYTYDNHSTVYGKLSPRLTQSVDTDYLTGVVTTTSYGSYDAFDFPAQRTVVSRIGPSGMPMVDITTWTYSHSNLPTGYVLGIVSEVTTVHNRDNDYMSMLGERSVFTYDSCFRPLTRNDYAVAASGGGQPSGFQTYLREKRRWSYDANGNPLTEETSPYDATEYTGVSYTYDNCGRHVISSTDALGHTTVYSDPDRFGNPRTVTDYRGRARTESFDPWGRRTKTVYADGTVDSTATAWGGEGVCTATRSVTGKPRTVAHYDAFSREVRSGNLRFNGQWQYTDTEYNQRGLVKRVSLSFRGSSPSYWNTCAYDSYGRRTGLSEASGRITTWTYSGTSVTQTKDGIAVTRTANAAGDIVSAADAAGTTRFTLRDDGLPASVTAPGSVTTTFTYDSYGRRTGLADPSAGTRSTSYSCAADGSTVTTEASALGSVATGYDKYGRITSVTRTGAGAFNTAYSYDAYGRLSSIVSTNGTSEEYTYDAYDRVTALLESAPDGKWLRKAFSYREDGNMGSVAYTSQSGYITTENYAYSNGSNTRIYLPDGTSVIFVAAENDLGQPTYATSGSVTRTYTYSAYGFPTGRMMKYGSTTLQNSLTYFNPANGNLTKRINALYGPPYEEEEFSYDALGRLVSANNSSMTYNVRGNMLTRTDSGTMSYADSGHPYRTSSLSGSYSQMRPNTQTVTYAAYDRPLSIAESVQAVTFTYNARYDRVKMRTSISAAGVTVDKYYLGHRYEREETSGGAAVTERLYLGGDAYSAPMVMQRTGSGAWTRYVIGRDYLGSITHLATTDGTRVAEYSYNAWGRLRNPETLIENVAQTPGTTLIGRGYCGHEHLASFGLINMNARLYDPLLGRFLSPDPFIQAPDFSQSFNRYAYALNNPLKYTDEGGEFIAETCFLLASAYLGGVLSNVLKVDNNPFNPINWNWKSRETYYGIISGISIGLGGIGVTFFPSIQGVFPRGLFNAASNVALNGGINALSGSPFFDKWKDAAISGFLGGALSGGVAACLNGNNVWWGNPIKNGASKWSFINLDKPMVYSSPVFDNYGKQKGECVLRCLEQFSESYGDTECDFDYWYTLNDNTLGVRPDNVSSLINKSGIYGSENVLLTPENIISAFNNDQRVLFGFASDGGAHAVMINKIKIWSDGSSRIYFSETSPVRIVDYSLRLVPGSINSRYPTAKIWTFYKL